jgi:hypothetical protein
MYIESVPNRDSPPAVLLRESYREGGKVRKRTLLNLSDWPPERIAGFKMLLKGGTVIAHDREAISIVRSLPHGHVASSPELEAVSSVCVRWLPWTSGFHSCRRDRNSDGAAALDRALQEARPAHLVNQCVYRRKRCRPVLRHDDILRHVE